MEVRGTGQPAQSSFDTNNINTVNNSSSKSGTDNNSIEINNINSKTENDAAVKNEKELDEKEVKKAVDKLNNFMDEDNVKVEYEIHPQFKDIIVKIVEKDTGKVISEVPPKKILDMVAKMCEMVGVLFDKKA